jgi:hypothetical protein
VLFSKRQNIGEKMTYLTEGLEALNKLNFLLAERKALMTLITLIICFTIPSWLLGFEFSDETAKFLGVGAGISMLGVLLLDALTVIIKQLSESLDKFRVKRENLKMKKILNALTEDELFLIEVAFRVIDSNTERNKSSWLKDTPYLEEKLLRKLNPEALKSLIDKSIFKKNKFVVLIDPKFHRANWADVVLKQ